ARKLDRRRRARSSDNSGRPDRRVVGDARILDRRRPPRSTLICRLRSEDAMTLVRYGAREIVPPDPEVAAPARPVVTTALTIIYETDLEIIADVLPPPLEPPLEPLVRVVMSTVAINGNPSFGSANFT